jgi:DNA-binding transcriptional LysR family regulator
MDVELRLLNCALALAEHGNFARAAKAIHMSQPSLSRNIQELERRLGVQLFSRNQRGVEVTSAGDILLQQAREIKAHVDDLVREMDLLRGMQKGELSIGAGIYPGPMFLDKAVGRLVRDHPAIQISLSYDHGLDLVPRLLSRELDLAVMYSSPRTGNPQFRVTKLKPHTIYYVSRPDHPLIKLRRKVHLPEVLGYPLMGPPRAPSSLVKRLMAAIPKSSRGAKPYPCYATRCR